MIRGFPSGSVVKNSPDGLQSMGSQRVNTTQQLKSDNKNPQASGIYPRDERIFQNLQINQCDSVSCSVVSDSVTPHGLQPSKLLCPWDSPGKNAEVGCHSLLQGIFPTQGSNPGLLHWQADVYFFFLFTTEPPGKPLKDLQFLLYEKPMTELILNFHTVQNFLLSPSNNFCKTIKSNKVHCSPVER